VKAGGVYIAMGITVVMRGDDHISNTPKQILLYRALGADLPVFAHLPMIHGMDGKKLSKRHGATAVGDYQHQGLLPGAMLNFLALLGWSPGGDREVMTLEEMISLFSPEGLQRKAAIFDPRKLEWMNGQHLSLVPLHELEPRVTPWSVRSTPARAAPFVACRQKKDASVMMGLIGPIGRMGPIRPIGPIRPMIGYNKAPMAGPPA
jgi:glutamyl-tRNA synthetase